MAGSGKRLLQGLGAQLHAFALASLVSASSVAQSTNADPNEGDAKPEEPRAPATEEQSGQKNDGAVATEETTPEQSAAANDGSSSDEATTEGEGAQLSDEQSKAEPSEPSNSQGQGDDDEFVEQPSPHEKREESDETQVASADPYEGYDQTGSPPPPPHEDEEKDGEAEEKKWDKDYDGRKEGTRGEDALIWLVRAPLYPVHLVLNYGVRYPLVYGITAAEEHKVFERIKNFATFADGKAGIYPLAFYDAGRGFWGGLNFFYDDLGTKGHDLRATAGIGTNNWIIARIKDSFRVFDNQRGKVSLSATFLRNPAFAYTGLGPDTDIEDEVFFGEEKFEFAADIEVAMQGLNRFTMRFDVRRAELIDGREPSISGDESPFDPSRLTGYDEYFTLARFGVKVELDTRHPQNDFLPGSGFRTEFWGAYNVGFGEPTLSFARYGLHPSVHWDITGANHMVELGVYTEAVTRIGGEVIPLNELVSLGGGEYMRGYLPGRFRGHSALVYMLDYSFPLFSFADAIFFTEVGNAYKRFFEDFTHANMALDFGTGLRSSFSRELSLWFAVGFGTNQFDKYRTDGFQIDKTRFFVGATRPL